MRERQRNYRGVVCATQGAGVREQLWRGSLAIVLGALAAGCAGRADAQWVERDGLGSGVPVLTHASAAFRSAAPVVSQGNARPERTAATALRLENRHKLMIFGSAIFLTGAIIGDDVGTVIMIGGAATALYGLYRTLWPPDENGRGAGRGVRGASFRDSGLGTRTPNGSAG